MSAPIPPNDRAHGQGPAGESAGASPSTPDWSQRVLDAALDAIVMIDENSLVTLWNAQAEETFGWSRDEAIGRPLDELIVPQRLREAHREGMRRFLETGTARVLNQRIELPAVHRDGREFPLELSIAAIPQGDRTTFSAFARDISAPKREQRLLEMQFALSETLRSASSVAEMAPGVLQLLGEFLDWDAAALWTLDADDITLNCTGFWAQENLDATAFEEATRSGSLRGGSELPEQALERASSVWIDDVTENSDSNRARAALDAGLAAGVAIPIVVEGRTRGVVELLRRGAMILDREIISTLTSAVDNIGQSFDRIRGVEALQLSESRLSAVIRNMLDGLAVIGPDHRIVTANDAFARMFGYAPERLVGQPIVELMPDRPEYRDPDQLAERYARSLEVTSEHEGLRLDGSLFPLRLELFRIETDEGEMSAAHVRDLSQEREVSRLKGHFVASVSHELRTPLTAVRGALGLLLADGGYLLSERARPMVEMAQRNTVQLNRLIDDLLDFERLDRRGLSMSSTPFAIDRAVESAVEGVGVTAREAGIELVVKANGAVALGDEARITQVLINFLSNALKFAPEGGAVSITTTLDDRCVEVSVADEGPGVPADLRTVIFEPFRQLEGSDSTKQRGSGLGLAICAAIVRQHQGDIGVDCPPEGGSRFWFRVPLAD